MVPSIAVSLNLPQNVHRRVEELWKEISDNMEIKNDEKTLFICAVYMAVQEEKSSIQNENSDPALTVSQLLEASDTNIMTFFSTMNKIQEICNSDDIDVLKALKGKYLIVLALYQKYEKMLHQVTKWEELQGKCNGTDDSTSESLFALLNEKKLLCWLLFIASKGKVQNELILAFFLLLCCVDYVIKMLPGFLLQQPYDAAVLSSTKSNNPFYFLELLCEQFHTSIEEVKTVYDTVWLPFIQRFLLPDGSINMNSLKETYTKMYRSLGDIDEMRFLDNDCLLLPVKSAKSRTTSNGISTRVPSTPVRKVLNTVRQFKRLLQHASDHPSPELHKFFQNCPSNPEASITQTITQLQHKFVHHISGLSKIMPEELAAERFQLAVKMYFPVLEAMLKSEEERLLMEDISNLLKNDIIHRALLACCTEIVLMIYGSNALSTMCNETKSQIAFPWILNVFDLKAYTFCKVLESFLKDSPKITKEIVLHLQSIEIQILEELAWQSDSPLFEILNQASDHSNLPLTHSDQENVSSLEMFMSPVKSPQKSPHSSCHRFPRSLTVFLNKVGHLVYQRLEKMCSSLKISPDLQSHIWKCFDHVVISKPHLMKNRNLNQILMCCIYAVCKILGKEILFSDISRTCCDVLNVPEESCTQVQGNCNEKIYIIRFYNDFFVVDIKDFMRNLANGRQNAGVATPTKTVEPPNLKYQVQENFSVSLLKNSPFKSPMSQPHLTPRSLQLYCFQNTPKLTKKLQGINRSVRTCTSNSTVNGNKTQKRLQFDSEPTISSEQNTSSFIKRLRLDKGTNQDQNSE